MSKLVADVDELSDISVDELADLYDNELKALLNKHCPVVKMRHRPGRLAPWLDCECQMSRRKSRMLERRYRRSKTDADRLAWIQQLKHAQFIRDQTTSVLEHGDC